MYQLIFKYSLLSVAVVAALGLSACGGSGGGTPQSTGVSGVSLSGKVAKGIVKNGVVVAEELDASQAVVAVVGNATTAADGTYSLTLSSTYQGGPVQISISTDASTEMKCDVPAGCGTRTDDVADNASPTTIDFGEWYKPAALSMTALIPNSVANATVSVNVTPFTHMAAVRAKSAATLDVAAIANANSEVSNLLGGIDVLNTAPVDITDALAIADASATETTYAALTSALANTGLVDPDNGQPDIAASIELLASSFAAGTLLADDSSGDDAAQISLQEIITAAGETLTETGTDDLTGVIIDLQNDIDTAVAGDGTIDPVASETAAEPNLLKAKAMMADVRTWGNVISTEVGNKGDLFGAEIDLAGNALDALDMTGEGAGDAFGVAIDAAFQRIDGTTTSSDLTTYVTDTVYTFNAATGAFDPVESTDFTAGSIALNTGVVTITDAVIYGHTVNLSMSIPVDGSSASMLSLGIQSATVVNTVAGTSMTVNSGLINATLAAIYTLDYEALDLGTAAPWPKVTDMSVDVDIALTQSKGVDMLGASVMLASPVTFVGTLTIDLDPIAIMTDDPDVNPNQGALPVSFNLTGTVSNASNSMDMSLVVNVTNTNTFEFVGDFAPMGTAYSAVVGRGDMVSWVYSNAGDVFDYSYPGFSLNLSHDSGTGAVTITQVSYGYSNSYPDSGSPEGGYIDLADFMDLNANIVPNFAYAFVDGEGDYMADLSAADFSLDGSADGLLQYPEFIVESAANWINADIGLTFTAQLDALPEARVNITADRTAFKAGDVAATVIYGARQLAISASIVSDDLDVVSVDGTLTITNQDNIVLALSDNNVDDLAMPTGTLSFNGIQYATITDSGGLLKVTYTDGTFEIF